MKKYLPLLAAMVTIATTSHAEVSMTLGGGVSISPEYEGSDSYDIDGLPYVALGWENEYRSGIWFNEDYTVMFGLLEVGIDLIDGLAVRYLELNTGNHSINFVTALNFDFGRDENDDSALLGLGDIDEHLIGELSIELGPGEEPSSFFFSIGLESQFDISNETNGIEISLGVNGNHKFDEKLLLSYGPSITWANENFMQSYFGIDTVQAANSSYSKFDADAGIKTINADITLGYSWAENWTFLSFLTYSYLTSDAAGSPLVELEGSTDQISFAIGVGYEF